MIRLLTKLQLCALTACYSVGLFGGVKHAEVDANSIVHDASRPFLAGSAPMYAAIPAGVVFVQSGPVLNIGLIGDHPQVLAPIVEPVSVDMVRVLATNERPADHARHDQAVHEYAHLFSTSTDKPRGVPTGMRVPLEAVQVRVFRGYDGVSSNRVPSSAQLNLHGFSIS